MVTDMTELLEVKSTMSSLEIAELTGKQHSNVMRDIRKILEQGVSEINFELSSYKQQQPNGGYKDVACYNLTKKGCLILASGYNAKLREKIIDRWEKLETEKRNGGYQVPSTFREALLLAAKQQEQLEQQQKQIEHKQATIESQATELEKQAPKVAYVDNVLQSVNTYNTNLIAKEMGMSAETLNKKLQEIGVQYRQGGVWVLTHKYQNKGYTKTRTHTFTRSDGTTGTSMLTVWTESGRAFIHQVIESAANKMAMAAACK